MNKKSDSSISLEKQLELKCLEADEWKSKYLRALADYQNLEKRIIQERTNTIKYASEKIIHELLTVIDTLEKAERHLNDPGLTLGMKSLAQVLSAYGVKKVEVLGEKFDPNLMECVEVVKHEKEGEIVEELRAGYMIGDKILRVAQVKVGKKRVEQKVD